MIINRYFYKEITLSLLAVLGIIMAIFVSHEFVHYLAKAAAGKVSITVVLSVMAVQIPYMLGLLLPLCLYLALIFVVGRWAVDSELTVLSSCGLRDGHLLRLIIVVALLVAAVSAMMTCWAIPNLMRVKTELLTRAGLSSLVDTLPPGRFWATKDNRYAAYIQEVSRDRVEMQRVFIAQQRPANDIIPHPHWAVMSANTAKQYVDPTSGAKYLLANNGHRFEGLAGQRASTLVSFEQYGVKLQAPPMTSSVSPVTQSTLEIIKGSATKPAYAAELSWRLGIPLSALLLAIMTLPLARVNPREGRMSRFFPAILIYVVYANLLFVNRNLIEKQVLTGLFGLVWMHVVALLVAILLWQQPRLVQWYQDTFRQIDRG